MNQVKLNKNSWHYRYYSQIVGSYTPKSLCPYFWSLVGLLMLSPFIFFIYYMTMFSDYVTKKIDKILPKKKVKYDYPKNDDEWVEYFKKQNELSERREKYWDKIFSKTTIIAKWIVLPILVIALVYLIYYGGEKYGWLSLLIRIGLALLFIGIIFGIVVFIEKITETLGGGFNKVWKYINPFKWTITKMIGGMIYAWYKKSCPLIEWEGGDTQTEESYL